MTSRVLSSVRDVGYGAALIPITASSLIRRSSPRGAVALAYVGLSVLLGIAALVPLGLLLLFVLRGVLYGFVDHGPYDHSWGGPGRAGAWAMHFLVSLPIAAVAVGALVGIAAVHRGLTAQLREGRLRGRMVWWALAVPVPAVAFFFVWLQQI